MSAPNSVGNHPIVVEMFHPTLVLNLRVGVVTEFHLSVSLGFFFFVPEQDVCPLVIALGTLSACCVIVAVVVIISRSHKPVCKRCKGTFIITCVCIVCLDRVRYQHRYFLTLLPLISFMNFISASNRAERDRTPQDHPNNVVYVI